MTGIEQLVKSLFAPAASVVPTFARRTEGGLAGWCLSLVWGLAIWAGT